MIHYAIVMTDCLGCIISMSSTYLWRYEHETPSDVTAARLVFSY